LGPVAVSFSYDDGTHDIAAGKHNVRSLAALLADRDGS